MSTWHAISGVSDWQVHAFRFCRIAHNVHFLCRCLTNDFKHNDDASLVVSVVPDWCFKHFNAGIWPVKGHQPPARNVIAAGHADLGHAWGKKPVKTGWAHTSRKLLMKTMLVAEFLCRKYKKMRAVCCEASAFHMWSTV